MKPRPLCLRTKKTDLPPPKHLGMLWKISQNISSTEKYGAKQIFNAKQRLSNFTKVRFFIVDYQTMWVPQFEC